MSQVYFIKTNESTFTLLSKTLDKFRDSCLYKVTKGEQSDFLLFDKGTNVIIADMDEDSLSFIINYLKGYPYYNIDEPLLSKVYYDADRLSIATLILEIKNQISEKNKLQETGCTYTEPININNFLSNIQKKDNYFTETSEPISFKFTESSLGDIKKRNPKTIRPKKIYFEE